MLHADQGLWDMQFVSDAEEAMRACEVNAFDVVVSDMRLPGVDGSALLTHIRSHCPDTTRIILSGYSEIARIRALSIAHCVLAKPCGGSELRAAIKNTMSIKQGFLEPMQEIA